MQFWLGGYGAGSGGNASGIGVLLAGAPDDGSAGGQLRFAGDAASADSPSWLAAHPTLDVVYAALEDSNAVQAFRRTGEASLAQLGNPVEAGTSLCHIAVAPDGGSLVASCWSDGRVVRMTLDAAGRPSTPVIAAAATDPYGSGSTPGEPAGAGSTDGAIDLAAASRVLRAAAGTEFAHLVPDYDEPLGTAPDETAEDAASRVSRAHEAVFLPSGLVVTTDMGLDLVRFWRPTPAGLRPVQAVALPLGTGPRHMVWHPSGHLYVVTELSREVYALAPDPTGSWRVVAGTSLGVGTLPGDTAAELAASFDGEFLYAGVRGSNTIATVRVRGAGDALEPVALVDSGVDWPRHHVVVRDTLLVAGEHSNDVASLTLDLRTGVPGRVRERVEAPSPTCLLPVR